MSLEETARSSLETGNAPQTQADSTNVNPDPPEPGEIANLMEGVGAGSALAPGEIVRGRVLKVTDSEVLVDLGLKCEGAIPRSEFQADDGRLSVGPGDLVDVWIERYDENEGTISISGKKAVRQKAWEEVERAFQEQTTLRGRVVERIKGGLTVDIGVRAFLPGSQADLRPLRNLESLNGKEVPCKVISLNKKRNNVVVSRKLALEEESNRRKAALLERLQPGAEVVGRVKNLTDYGVFLDLGGMDGLLHLTDLSWGRVRHPSEVVQVGQEIKVKVLKFDRERERVSLGLKQLAPDPWDRVPSAYRVGDRITGRVVSIVDYGVFVELEPGVEGLIHISEMSWSKRLKHPSKLVVTGDRAEVAVLGVNREQRRISLSLKQTLPDPWANLGERLSVGSVVEGRVRNLTDFGAFVDVGEGVDGLIRLSDLTWTRRVKHPSEVLKKGQKVEAVVLSLDAAQHRLSLGFKQLHPDVWTNFFSKTQVGDLARGKVARVASFGAFVELAQGIEGLCHISEQDPAANGGGPLEVGKEFDFRIIRLNPADKKIGLSMKNAAKLSPSPEACKGPEEPASVMAQALSSAGVIAPEPPLPTGKADSGPAARRAKFFP